MPVKQESRVCKNCHTNKEDVIARDDNSAVKEMVLTEMSLMDDEGSDDTLRT